ncbi:MAG: exosortase system-associated protein, TIGR04073 family [Candidatus Omnitrophica bacterium]|nr:exosortase system-associated protein, TIGR04073 family [Candidatus Omnitrophota bacterium]
MKSISIIMAMVILTWVPSAHAENNPGAKLGRGIVNIVTAPVEIPKQTRAYWIEGAQLTDHILIWAGCGTVWGLIQTVKRAGSGVWDIVSFPFDKPADFEPLLSPDYVFENWPSDPDVFIFKRGRTNE